MALSNNKDCPVSCSAEESIRMNGTENRRARLEIRVIRRNRRRWMMMIAFGLQIIFASVSYGTTWSSDPSGQGADQIIQGELHAIQADMESVYRAMFALIEQAFEVKMDQIQQVHAAGAQKHQAATEAVNNKRQEIKEKVRAAYDAFVASVCRSVANCVAVAEGVAKTSESMESFHAAPDAQRAQRFAAEAGRLKKSLARLRGEVNKLRDMINSGRLDKVPDQDLENMKTRFYKSLQDVRIMNRKAVERAPKRPGTRRSNGDLRERD